VPRAIFTVCWRRWRGRAESGSDRVRIGIVTKIW
jgi:hypothetical protein